MFSDSAIFENLPFQNAQNLQQQQQTLQQQQQQQQQHLQQQQQHMQLEMSQQLSTTAASPADVTELQQKLVQYIVIV